MGKTGVRNSQRENEAYLIRQPANEWDPPTEEQYTNVSRIPSVTTVTVVDLYAFKRVQTYLLKKQFLIIPTSTDGHEYLTEFGRP